MVTIFIELLRREDVPARAAIDTKKRKGFCYACDQRSVSTYGTISGELEFVTSGTAPGRPTLVLPVFPVGARSSRTSRQSAAVVPSVYSKQT